MYEVFRIFFGGVQSCINESQLAFAADFLSLLIIKLILMHLISKDSRTLGVMKIVKSCVIRGQLSTE